MNLNNINSLTLNYKTLTNVTNENYNFNESQQIGNNKSDSETIATLKSLKQLYLELMKIKDELSKELEKHNYENGLLYFNNLLLTDCYTFKNSLESIINISMLIYDSTSNSMNLDSYNTLLYSLSAVSIYSNTPNISNVNNEYDKQYIYKSVHLPHLLLYTPRTTDFTRTMTFNSEQTQNFTIYTSNQIRMNSNSNSNNKSNIFTEYMAEEITNDAIYDNSESFITIPTLINYKPETDNTWIYSNNNNNLNKFLILKFCRLIDIPEVRPTYLYPGNTKLSSDDVLYSPCFMIPEQMSEEQRTTFLKEYTGTGKIENGFINEENVDINGTVYSPQDTNLSTMTIDEYKAAYNFNELHENISNKSPIIEFNNKKYLLNKNYPYRCAVEYPAYLQYYFHDYYDFNTNNGGTGRRSNCSTINLMDFSQVGIAYYEEETDVLCYSENGETKLVKNRVYANRFTTRATQNTAHEYFTNISESTQTFIQKMKIKHIVYSFVITNESYQYHSNYEYSPNPTDEDLKIFNLTTKTSKENGNRCLTIYGNSSGKHLYDCSNSRISSQTINVLCPGIDLNPDKLDLNSDRDLSKDRKSLCISENYTGLVGESGLAIFDNANNENNIEVRYGYGRKIKGGNPIENKNTDGIKISDSRRCIEGIYFKILLDVYAKSNKLNNTVLIKRIKNRNRVNMLIRRNNHNINDFYERVYNYPTVYFDTSFKSLNLFYECCYGLPYDKKAENILYNYFIHKKFTKDTFEYSDKYNLEDYDFNNVDIIKESMMSGELYSELVFKSNNVKNINNIYIASKINSYDDFKNIKPHKYVLFDFLNSETVKTIDVGELVEKALIYFKTKDISLIRTDFKSHEYRLEQIKHDNIEELVPDGEDDIDDYGFRYYRYIINPNAF